jgi:transcriptional regulator with XRE-family HTH domain
MLIADGVGDRLRDERERLGLNQTDFGQKVGVSRGTQKAYELGANSPDLRYVAALQSIGADIEYILTGERPGPSAEELTPLDKQLLSKFLILPDADKQTVLRVVAGMALAIDLGL